MRLWEEEEEEGGKDVVECEINRGGKSRESIYPPGHPLHSDESLFSWSGVDCAVRVWTEV